MKTIIISAAGTASAWQIIKTIKDNFAEYFRIIACDINPPHLVPAAKLADKFYQVPKIKLNNYERVMLDLFQMEQVDIFVPLIDAEVALFPSDHPKLTKLNIKSTAPPSVSAKLVANKKKMFEFLKQSGINIPKTIHIDEIDDAKLYFVKPIDGFGSKGACRLSGRMIKQLTIQNLLIQEVCYKPEITIEIFKHEEVINTVCRERIETKSGVCTKARVFYDDKIQQDIETISNYLTLPTASCIQMMRNHLRQWVVTDVNLRLGGGTALSGAIGWNLPAAALVVWGDLVVNPLVYLNKPVEDRYVVRVFNEVVTV